MEKQTHTRKEVKSLNRMKHRPYFLRSSKLNELAKMLSRFKNEIGILYGSQCMGDNNKYNVEESKRSIT